MRFWSQEQKGDQRIRSASVRTEVKDVVTRAAGRSAPITSGSSGGLKGGIGRGGERAVLSRLDGEKGLL
jgi:hypothetical protein